MLSAVGSLRDPHEMCGPAIPFIEYVDATKKYRVCEDAIRFLMTLQNPIGESEAGEVCVNARRLCVLSVNLGERWGEGVWGVRMTLSGVG
jgi:hypothetical protein